ncbi:hypothetical protein C2W62_26145 [Candidatus Entotheonella serta]|nr:hypothetical protein C2W62_26145 [Candidatus Entotheonella serta]
MRLGRLWAGWTLGLHEMLIFYPSTVQDDSAPIGIQTRAYGLDLTPISIALGFDRRLMIPYPKQPDVIQMLFYSEDDPEATIVIKKEVP